jgi:hypothetical protein
MSRRPQESGPEERGDALPPSLRDALRDLPVIEPDARAAARSARTARAAYVDAFGGARWRAIGRPVARLALPVGLAGLVGIYGTWAVSTALALM